MDAAGVPVIGIPHQRDVILDHALRHLEGAGAGGRRVEARGILQRLGRGDQARAVRELRQQRREGALEIEPHGQRIDHVDGVERRHLRLAAALGQVHGAVEVERHGGRIELGAVREFDAGPELEGDGLAVVRGRPGERQLRHQVQIRRRVDQLVAEAHQHDAADETVGARGIEAVGVLLQADPDHGFRVRAGGDR